MCPNMECGCEDCLHAIKCCVCGIRMDIPSGRGITKVYHARSCTHYPLAHAPIKHKPTYIMEPVTPIRSAEVRTSGSKSDLTSSVTGSESGVIVSDDKERKCDVIVFDDDDWGCGVIVPDDEDWEIVE
jgi:hypothetical protein